MTSDTFCVLPWIHLASHPHGGTTLCCNAYHSRGISRSRNWAGTNGGERDTIDNRFLDLRGNTIDEMMNSDSFRDVRQRMLNGTVPYACERCFREEAQGITSKRARENLEYQHFDIDAARARTDGDGRISIVDLEFVELRLGNICNAKCRTCNPWSSSKWISDHVSLTEAHGLPTWDARNNSFDWPENEAFWDDLFHHTRNVKVFYINGGEPTLIAQHFRFLERMVDAGRTHVKLWYNINMTNMDDGIIDLWRRFDQVEIGMSIDDLDERNTYIRHPTRWDHVVANMESLLRHRDRFRLGITQTVSWMNYFYLGEFYQWATGHGLHVHHNVVNDPMHFSPDVLPLEVRLDVNRRLGNLLPDHMLRVLRQFESKPTDMDLFNRAWRLTMALDKLRDESFEKSFPDLYRALEASGVLPRDQH